MMSYLPDSNGDDSSAALHPQSHVWNATYAFVTSMSLKCAVELGIPEAVQRCGGGTRPVSLADLAADLAIPPTHVPQLGRVMRMLVHARYFACKQADNGAGKAGEGYVLTPLSTFLLSGGAAFVKMTLCPASLMAHFHLSSWLRGGQEQSPTPFHVANGEGLWEHAGRVAEFNEMFNTAIAHDAGIVAAKIVSKCGWIFDGVRSLVDVGGGNVGLARAMAKAFPDLKCTVLDLPHVIPAESSLTTAATDEKVVYVGGNMFEHIPPADVAVLKYILHDYDDEDCVKILRRCKKAINPSKGGKVIIIDIVVNFVKDVDAGDRVRLVENQLFGDMQMLTVLGGKEREEEEWAKIFGEAEFTGGYQITPVHDILSVIKLFP